MEKQTVVALLGESMFMDGVALSLTTSEAISLIRLDPAAVNLKDCLQITAPNFILFELGTVWSLNILSLLAELPGLLLVGLDADCNRVIIMKSWQRQANSIRELAQLFQDEVRISPRPAKEGHGN